MGIRLNAKPSVKKIIRLRKKASARLALQPATYDERVAADKLKSQKNEIAAFVADVKAGRACFTDALALRDKMNALGIKGLNLMWRAGKAWQRASDKNQYDFYFVDYVIGRPATATESGRPGLVAEAQASFVSKEVVRFCLHLANTLTEPVRTVEQAAPLVQKCFIALGFEQAGTRAIEQAHPPRNIFSELVGEAKGAAALLRDLKAVKPLDLMTPDEQDTFLREWKPVVDDYQEVQRLRRGV